MPFPAAQMTLPDALAANPGRGCRGALQRATEAKFARKSLPGKPIVRSLPRRINPMRIHFLDTSNADLLAETKSLVRSSDDLEVKILYRLDEIR
jgi:hypothetical protein